MVDYLAVILNSENIRLNERTLKNLTDEYGVLNYCKRDIKTIEKEINTLMELKEEYLKMEKNIEDRIGFLSNLETKTIIKIIEHPKMDKNDYYLIQVQVFQISIDNKVIVNVLESKNCEYKERNKVFYKYLDEVLEKFPNSEIYSNKVLKSKYKYQDLSLLSELEDSY